SSTRPARFTALVGEATHALVVEPRGEGRYRIAIDGRERIVDGRETGTGTFSILIDHAAAEVSVSSRGDEFQVAVGGRTHRLRLLDERARLRHQRAAAVDGAREVRAAMPGKVVAVLAEAGARVERGQGLLVIEAMKMENEIAAPRAGPVAAGRRGRPAGAAGAPAGGPGAGGGCAAAGGRRGRRGAGLRGPARACGWAGGRRGSRGARDRGRGSRRGTPAARPHRTECHRG